MSPNIITIPYVPSQLKGNIINTQKTAPSGSTHFKNQQGYVKLKMRNALYQRKEYNWQKEDPTAKVHFASVPTDFGN